MNDEIQEILDLLEMEKFLSLSEKKLLSAIYDFPNCSATAPQLAKALGYSHYGAANLLVGKTGKKFMGNSVLIPLYYYNDKDRTPEWFSVIFNGEQTNEGYLWTLKPEFKAALDRCSWINDFSIPEEIDPSEAKGLTEGAVKTRFVNAYERSRKAKELCLKKYGCYKCKVCGFDFEEHYGELGKNYIHVHHLKPLSEIGKEYEIDPETDLAPVCPNCHAMLHRREPALTIEELKQIIKEHSLRK